MLVNHIHKLDKSTRPIENFAFAVHDILLKVQGNGLGNAEILHGFGNGYPNLFANSKEMVDCRSASENNGGMLKNIDALLAKLLIRDYLNH